MPPDSRPRPGAAARRGGTSAEPTSPSTASRRWPRACGCSASSTSSGPSWRVTDLAAAAGLPMPTVYRVVHDPDRRGLPRPPAQRRLPAGRQDPDPRHRGAAQPRPGRHRDPQAAAARRDAPARRSTSPCSPATGCSTWSGCATPTWSPPTSRSARRCRPSPPRSASCCSPTSTRPTCATRITDAVVRRAARPQRQGLARRAARRARRRSASRAGPCRTRSSPTACARSPARSPGRDGRVVAGVNLAVQARDWSTQRIVRELRPARPGHLRGDLRPARRRQRRRDDRLGRAWRKLAPASLDDGPARGVRRDRRRPARAGTAAVPAGRRRRRARGAVQRVPAAAPARAARCRPSASAVRYETTLPDRAREIAILVVAAHWDSAFEWYAHEAVGRHVGLTDDELDGARAGHATTTWPTRTSGWSRDRRTRCSPTRRPRRRRRTPRPSTTLGRPRLFELLTLVGYYATLALQLRVFRVAAPD